MQSAMGSFKLCSNLVLALVAKGWVGSWEKGGIKPDVAMRITKYMDIQNQHSVEVSVLLAALLVPLGRWKGDYGGCLFLIIGRTQHECCG